MCRSTCGELQEQGARERRGRVSVLCHVRECDARNNERVLVLYTMPIESVLLVRFSWRLWRAGSTLVALTLPLTAALSRASPRCPGAGRGLHRRGKFGNELRRGLCAPGSRRIRILGAFCVYYRSMCSAMHTVFPRWASSRPVDVSGLERLVQQMQDVELCGTRDGMMGFAGQRVGRPVWRVGRRDVPALRRVADGEWSSCVVVTPDPPHRVSTSTAPRVSRYN